MTTLTMKTNKLNEKFKKATKAQKRVMIAQDVLDQIRAKRYHAVEGEWVDPIWKKDAESQKIKSSPEYSVKDAFETKAIVSCEVCALGGLFMSCANLNNHTTIKDLGSECYYNFGDLIVDDIKFSNGLNRIFTKNQLALIEKYYEGGGGYFRSTDDEEDKVGNFYETFSESRRLEIIMQNIIDNDGTFKPNKLNI